MLDPAILEQCTDKAERLLSLERDVEQAKADYHFAIRRLHLSGGSYREIAAALGLSHQRVNQIVDADSRSWLRRWLTPPRANKRLACSFCGRSSQRVARLVAGPRVEICNDCIAAAQAVLAGERPARGSAPFALLDASSRVRCSFCGKPAGKGRRLTRASADAVCDGCAALARQIAEGSLV